MLLLMSSGARRRYRDDIVRALALPKGGELQFRYDTSLVADEVAARVRDGSIANELGIICYAFVARGEDVSLLPCRFCTVVAAQFVGSSCVLRLRVDDFAEKLDHQNLLLQLSPEVAATLPAWRSEDGKDSLQGKFVISVRQEFQQNRSDSLVAFENAARSLGTFQDFIGTVPVFFTVRTVSAVHGSNRASECTMAEGAYHLVAGETYDLDAYCFSTDADRLSKHPAVLRVASDVSEVLFPLGKEAEIDSRYDLKQFRFGTEHALSSFGAAVGIRVVPPKGDETASSPEIVLPLQIRGRWRSAAIRIAMLAVSTSTPAMIAAGLAKNLNVGIALIMLAAGLAAGMATVISSSKKN